MRSLSLAAVAAALLVVAACGKSTPAKRGYRLYATAQRDSPPGGVKVKLTVPKSWKDEVDAMGGPAYTLPDLEQIPQVSVILTPCPAEGDCMKQAISLQYDAAELAEAKREDLDGGRVFIVHDTKLANSGRRRVHARLFVPHAASRSVVSCVAMLMDAAGDRLPEIRKVCESITL